MWESPLPVVYKIRLYNRSSIPHFLYTSSLMLCQAALFRAGLRKVEEQLQRSDLIFLLADVFRGTGGHVSSLLQPHAGERFAADVPMSKLSNT
jgi:hypothetical protein